jgi:hypothetical protein
MKRAALAISAEEKDFPDQLRQSRTAPVRDVQRAQILWRYQCGEKVAVIVRALNTTRNSVLKWIDKALQLGVVAGIRHTPHTPRQAVITDDAKTWMVHLACSKPKDPGYAAELWTRSALAGHVRSESVGAGFPALKNPGKATVQRILAAQELQPHKVRHYLERRDPDFEFRMREVLLVYKEVEMENDAAGRRGGTPGVITVSLDEKPRVQAIANTAPDLPPVPGKYPTFARDHEYVRHGTLSILAALDLFDGHVTAQVEERHRSIRTNIKKRHLEASEPPRNWWLFCCLCSRFAA